MKRVDLYLKEEQIEALNNLKETQGVPVSESVRRAIDAYLKIKSSLEGDLNAKYANKNLQ